jgi:hypothetical protein
LTPFILCVSLIAERTRLAASVSLPAYMVVSEQSLLQLAEMRPTSPASLARIQVDRKPQLSRLREDRLNPFYFQSRIHKKNIKTNIFRKNSAPLRFLDFCGKLTYKEATFHDTILRKFERNF